MARDVISAARATALLNTHGGPALLLSAPLNTTFPTALDDIVNIAGGASQWTPQTGWTSLGLTRGGINVSRGMEEYKRDADQSYGPYDSRPTSWSAMVSTELLETSPTAMQIAWVGGPIATVAKVQTTLQTGPAAGATTFTMNAATVGNISSIVSGDYISIGTGPQQEYAMVTINTAGAVTVSSALQYAHVSGELIVKFATNTLAFGTSRSVPPRLLAVIAPLGYDDPAAGGIVNGLRAWVFRRCKLEGGQRQIQLSNSADWTLPVSFYAYPDLSITDPEFDTFVMYEFSY